MFFTEISLAKYMVRFWLTGAKGSRELFKSDRNLLSLTITVNFYQSQLLQNHWANFDQTLHKIVLDEWDSSLFK